MQNIGSLSEVNNNSNEVTPLVKSIIQQIKSKFKINGAVTIYSFKTQIVAGTIYFIKISADEKYFHIKVLEYLPHENKDPELLAYLENQTRDSEITYF
tara:strand:+ start:72 stop:365 length:294 start_codon:yes stop_codon:yes gene_type:complete